MREKPLFRGRMTVALLAAALALLAVAACSQRGERTAEQSVPQRAVAKVTGVKANATDGARHIAIEFDEAVCVVGGGILRLETLFGKLPLAQPSPHSSFPCPAEKQARELWFEFPESRVNRSLKVFHLTKYRGPPPDSLDVEIVTASSGELARVVWFPPADVCFPDPPENNLCGYLPTPTPGRHPHYYNRR